MSADKTPWSRKPEPHDELEGADEYDQMARENFAKSDLAFAQELAKSIPEMFTGPIIDLGSGPGNIAVLLAKELNSLGRNNQVICYDYSQEMLDKARERVKEEGLLPQQFTYQTGKFTQLAEKLAGVKNAFVFSNTALHETDSDTDLPNIFENIAIIIGSTGGCYIRDLLLPENQEEADQWKAEVVDPINLAKKAPREYRLFNNSQRAGFPLKTVQAAIDSSSLLGKGILSQGNAENKTSRYWMLEVKPPTATANVVRRRGLRG